MTGGLWLAVAIGVVVVVFAFGLWAKSGTRNDPTTKNDTNDFKYGNRPR